MSYELPTKKTNQTSSNETNLTSGKGVQIDAMNLSYSVYFNRKRQALLRNVNFHLDPGDMCALMGPSGAGKRFAFN
jgi:ABC-type multidrug transport system ATPase subunit